MFHRMKITDMNVICLEECFEYLEVGDFLNVVDANKRRRAAQFVYFWKYSESRVDFNVLERKHVRFIEVIILFMDLETSLQLLHCFGNLIKESLVNTNSLVEIVLIHLNGYCVESLARSNFIVVMNEKMSLDHS